MEEAIERLRRAVQPVSERLRDAVREVQQRMEGDGLLVEITKRDLRRKVGDHIEVLTGE